MINLIWKRPLALLLALTLVFSLLRTPTAVAGNYGEDSLTGLNRTLYTLLKTKVTEAAAATTDVSTTFEFSASDLGLTTGTHYTAAELGVTTLGTVSNGKASLSDEAKTALLEKVGAVYDLETIQTLLRVNCPYELYWFDKIAGISARDSFSYNFSYESAGAISEVYLTKYTLTITFSVSSNYRASSGDAYTLSGAMAVKAQAARSTAESIVAANAGKTDYEKLLAYKTAICDLVSYNDEAAADSYTGGYGGPWQLLYVFDGDESTNVVCEGYAKAFQYLCDLTDFASNMVTCYIVDGTTSGGTGGGSHMWNVVTMNDGKNYLVDVTNCDEGNIGADDKLFLAGTNGSISAGFSFALSSSLNFVYSDSTKELYGTDASSILNLAASNYDPTVTCAAHTDNDMDSICDVCGARVESSKSMQVAGYSLSLGSRIGVNFYVQLSAEAAKDATAAMHFSVPNGGETTTSEVPVSDAVKTTVDGEDCYVFSCEVSVKDMTGTITAYMTFDSGKTISKTYTYTVQEYAEYLLNHTSASTEYADAAPLVKAMLNYGAYAQKYFGWKTEDLANSILSDGDKSNLDSVSADTLKSYAWTSKGSSEKVNFSGANLVLLSETTLKLYFTEAEGSSVTYIVNGTEITPTVVDDMKCVAVEGIASSALGTSCSVTVDGLTVNYSPMSYAYAALTSTAESISNNTNLHDLVKALYLYQQAAESYKK